MNLKQKIKLVLSGKVTWIDVWNYWLGMYRYYLYLRACNISVAMLKRPTLIRKHIWDQILWRIKIMDQECYNNGACKICGCDTPALQMATKSCEGNYYPPMLSKRKWYSFFLKKKPVSIDCKGHEVWSINAFTGKPDKFIWDKDSRTYNQIISGHV